jgi:hypothetical protein
MNISGTSTAITWPTTKSIGTGGTAAAKDASGQAPGDVAGDFLRYAKMSPMERMRANILKGMNLTEEQLGALPQDEQRKIEEKIKDSIRKMVSDDGRTGQLVDVSA